MEGSLKGNEDVGSITFEVENNFSKPKEFYPKTDIKSIFNQLFRRAKVDRVPENCIDPERYDEIMEILMYNFDTEEKSFYSIGKKSLIQGLILAYKNHYPITITPDMIWILILQGYSKFMEKYSELVREKYVDFQGKKTIKVEKMNISLESATQEIWQEIIDDFIDGIQSYVGGEIISNLESNFSTTNSVTLATSQATIMSAMKNYFKFSLIFGGCGISSITLEGTLKDWEKIKLKLEFLSKGEFGLNWWTKHLIPIIDKIIMTKSYFNRERKINDEIKNFWKDMIRLKGKGDLYDPHIINGWIIKFIPDFRDNIPKLYEEIDERNVPDFILSCPVELTVYNYSEIKKTEYKCSLSSGFYGMVQDYKTFNVRPVIGYALVVEEKKESFLTLEEKNKILKLYFN